MAQSEITVTSMRKGPLTDDERREIYRRYFLEKASMETIRIALGRTRLTVSRCIDAQRLVLESLREGLGTGRPRRGIHYARYEQRVVAATSSQPRQRRRGETTYGAEHFIAEWWHRQQREAQNKRWMDAARLYARYCAAIPDTGTPISYRTFTRAIKRVVGDAYHTAPGRPKPRRRGRPKGSGKQ